MRKITRGQVYHIYNLIWWTGSCERGVNPFSLPTPQQTPKLHLNESSNKTVLGTELQAQCGGKLYKQNRLHHNGFSLTRSRLTDKSVMSIQTHGRRSFCYRQTPKEFTWSHLHSNSLHFSSLHPTIEAIL